ncbi:hypothetical protein AAHB37_09390 [Glutamicibacter halophytocola]|uniref:hypothetical protein n=1 Tax=Glutamicibacter halophytocola TaxID=1933880 RepID=UPI00321BF7C3
MDAFVNLNPVHHTNLGFNPKALVEKNGFDSRLYATNPDGTLYVVDGYESTVVNNTWAGIRTMTDVVVTDKYDSATGVTYTYAITDQGALYRYTQSQATANMFGRVQVSPRGWWPLKGFSYWMTKTLSNGDQADIFLSNASDGRLLEYTIPPGNADELVLKKLFAPPRGRTSFPSPLATALMPMEIGHEPLRCSPPQRPAMCGSTTSANQLPTRRQQSPMALASQLASPTHTTADAL